MVVDRRLKLEEIEGLGIRYLLARNTAGHWLSNEYRQFCSKFLAARKEN